MRECIFKPGQEYLTRNGLRAKVYATDVGGKGLIHGAIEGVSGHWWQNEWNPDGREWSFTGRRESDHDLMPPAYNAD